MFAITENKRIFKMQGSLTDGFDRFGLTKVRSYDRIRLLVHKRVFFLC